MILLMTKARWTIESTSEWIFDSFGRKVDIFQNENIEIKSLFSKIEPELQGKLASDHSPGKDNQEKKADRF